jgi:hypothetical protein
MEKCFRKLRLIAVLGPGLLIALADTGVGNIVTAAQSGAQGGYGGCSCGTGSKGSPAQSSFAIYLFKS